MIGRHGPPVVLLHGLTSSGDQFGDAYDRLAVHGQVIIPDLLGFGRSLDLDRSDFSVQAHLRALDAVVDEVAGDRPLTVVGHSMGSIVALRWAAARSSVTRAVAFSPPLYESRDEASNHIARMGPLERLFALESPLARTTCQLMCDFRTVAQWVAVAISPQWPVRIARSGVLHTWEAYLGGMNGIIQDPGWQHALETLADRDVPVTLAGGARDPVQVAGRSAELAARLAAVESTVHPSAGHDLPISHAGWCVGLIERVVDRP